MTSKELKQCIKYEKTLYFSSSKEKIKFWLLHHERYFFWKYLYLLRKEEIALLSNNFFSKLIRAFYLARRNRLGNKIGVIITPLTTGKGINIFHKNVIINAHIGNDCVFHGNNCLGNNEMAGISRELVPVVGDNVEFGFGSMGFGKIRIASYVKIGAGSVIVHDIETEHSIFAGVPAKQIKI